MELNRINICFDTLSPNNLLKLWEKEKSGASLSESDKKLLIEQKNMLIKRALQQLKLAQNTSKMSIREFTEQMERATLSRFATLSINSKGREKPDKIADNDDTRTIFQVDKDRITYSTPFRRLANKTQVFIAPNGDHYTMRLTHSLEVSQISRSIARGLYLNQDLAEAASLGHDLGHPPFGHAGEAALNEMSPNGFKHNEQSVRVLEVVGRRGGYNLSWEVRDASLNHNKNYIASTLEGQIIKYSDRIAYISRDVVDLIRAGILTENNLPQECVAILGKSWSRWINTMIRDVINASKDKPFICMSPEVEKAAQTLKYFMLEEVFNKGYIKDQNEKAKHVVRELYTYFKQHPNKLPNKMKVLLNTYDLDTVICDYISSMTDRYALNMFNNLFIP